MENNLCGNLINEYYVRQFRGIAADRAARIAALKTREDAERYVEEVRAAVRISPSRPVLPHHAN